MDPEGELGIPGRRNFLRLNRGARFPILHAGHGSPGNLASVAATITSNSSRHSLSKFIAGPSRRVLVGSGPLVHGHVLVDQHGRSLVRGRRRTGRCYRHRVPGCSSRRLGPAQYDISVRIDATRSSFLDMQIGSQLAAPAHRDAVGFGEATSTCWRYSLARPVTVRPLSEFRGLARAKGGGNPLGPPRSLAQSLTFEIRGVAAA